ncbi:hypothetical protein HQ487_02380 [Candidatus Uhrbacteria bacterium]|nr:hypothetical protein [Candidatus Uhrbacteria bacterium]
MLNFYYGEECPHCHHMLPIVDKLISEGIEVAKLETWHNDANAKLLDGVDRGRCGGVPFFHNTETDQFICGSSTEERIRAWAAGEELKEE